MPENEIYYKSIIDRIRNAIKDKSNYFTLKNLMEENYLLDDISETDIIKAINWAIRNNIIIKVNKNDEKMYLLTDNDVEIEKDNVCISITPPKAISLSIKKIINKNGFISTDLAFKKVISNAQNKIRIASPFLQKNVKDENSLPDLEEIILAAYRRGCKFIILSREVNNKRFKDLNWLVDLSKRNGYEDKLEIFDYYKSKKDGMLYSSNHAKLLIADNNMAYIGSAELRLNSLYRNFEVGLVLEGPSVIGLTEIFDCMINNSQKVY